MELVVQLRCNILMVKISCCFLNTVHRLETWGSFNSPVHTIHLQVGLKRRLSSGKR